MRDLASERIFRIHSLLLRLYTDLETPPASSPVTSLRIDLSL